MSREPNAIANRRILLVDDNEEIHREFKLALAPARESAQDMLAQQIFGSSPAQRPAVEFQIESAYQGDEAIERVPSVLAEGTPYALAIVDMRMPPGPDGLETIEHLLTLDPELQLVLCTAYSDYGWDEIQKRIGLTDRVLIAKKPVERVELQQLALALTQKWNEAHAKRDAELRLERLASQTEMIMRSFTPGLMLTDPQGAITYANPGAEALLGLPAAELRGQDPHALIHARGRPCPRQPCALSTRLGSEPWRSDDQTLCTDDGEDIPISCVWTPIRDDGGVMRGALFSLRDLREQRVLESRLRQAQKLDTIGRLAAGVAHEINTPTQYVSDGLAYLDGALAALGNIVELGAELARVVGSSCDARGLAERFQRAANEAELDVLLQEAPGALRLAVEGTERIARIVKSINEFAHPSDGAKEPVDLNHVVENALTVSFSSWKHLANVKKELAADLPLVPGERGDLEQLVMNLLVNACHAIEDVGRERPERDGWLRVTTAAGAEFVELGIEDNGCGMSEATRSRIFDPFFTTKKVGRGTGQGLAIAHTIVVTRHGGTLDCQTEPGRGTRFVIRLPLDPDTPLLPPVHESAPDDRPEETS